MKNKLPSIYTIREKQRGWYEVLIGNTVREIEFFDNRLRQMGVETEVVKCAHRGRRVFLLRADASKASVFRYEEPNIEVYEENMFDESYIT